VKVRFFIALALELSLFAALNFFDDWTLEAMPKYFVAAAILCGLAYLISATEFSNFGRASLGIFWSVTIVLRLLALPLTPASEVWRFQADAAMQRAGLDPYQTTPGDAKDRIPHPARVPRPEESAAFAPGAELIFRLVPGSETALGYKLLFGLAELLAIALLLRVTDLQTAAWLAWNPLLAYSFFGAGHFDSIILLALVGMIFCLVRFEQQPATSWNFAFGASIALGIAIALRPICLVLLLPVIFALRRHAAALLFGLIIPFFCALLFSFPSSAFTNLFGDFDYNSRLNDLFWWVIEETVLPNWHQQYFRYDIVIVIIAAIIGTVFWRNWRRGMLWTLGAAIILTPFLHPWYVAWILPVATWRRAYAWHFLSVTIFAYYLFFNERLFALPWHAEPWMRGMILLPVLFALVVQWRQQLAERPVTV
jgi:alpha-1,6-mannosyltransferase